MAAMSAPPVSDALLARAVALDLLQAVLGRGQPLDSALAAHPRLCQLAPRDRGFARMLVATTLRRLGQLDAILAQCLDHPLPARAAAVQDLLRLGACQLLFLRTPPHAAVDSSVALTGRRGGEAGYKGLVNAVLRRIAREGAAMLGALDCPQANLPEWLWRSWSAAYGRAVAEAIARAQLQEPPLDITLKDAADPAEASLWAERLGALMLPTGSLRRLPMPGDSAAGGLEHLPGFEEGAWWIQDAAAAIPARLLGPLAGRRAIDLCAAPGGKTAQLAAAGAIVTAVDRSPQRLLRLERNLARLGLHATAVAADAALWRPAEPAPAVLLDAPCSSTGTIRRHPDVPWLKSPADIAKLAPLQARLLRAALEMTAPGGRLVYCVCSLEPGEGPEQLAALFAEGAPVEREPITAAEVGGLAELTTPEGDLRTLPCHLADLGGLDGFYIARLRRRT